MMKNLVRVIRWIGELLVILTAIIAIAWAFGAVWFDAPFGNANKALAGLLAVASAAALVFVRTFWRKIGAVALLFSGVLIWWLTLSPTNDSDWQADVAQKAWADIQGDEVTFQRPQLRLPHRDRLHPALGDADRAAFADHRHRSRDRLLGFAMDCASHRQFPIH